VSDNPLGLKRLHHAEFWVGNAKQAAYFYRKAFGFSQVAYAGLETGSREAARYALAQHQVRLVLSTPLGPGTAMGAHIDKHGDGVRDLAFTVEDAEHAHAEAVRRGARSVLPPEAWQDDHGTVRRSAVGTYGDTVHSFLEFVDYRGPFLPGFRGDRIDEEDAGLLLIDHCVGNVERGKMDVWADFYRDVFGFARYMSFDDKDISTDFTALQSVVMSSDAAHLKMPINEPAPGKKRSQIEEYLDFYRGPGIQHLALLTKDIRQTIRSLRARGVGFLRVPDAYYDTLPARVGEIDEDFASIRELGILVDRDPDGYLLQLFSTPLEDRPTLFFEIIQRKGSRGFGKGNFKALFVSIEEEQAKRGTL
jgi:4-hydroxyphenylpyruvate dioxygenase